MKNKFKQTELEELPEDWEAASLGDITQLTMGQSPPGNTYNSKNGMPFLQGKAEFSSLYPTHKKYTTKPLKLAKKGSVLMSVRAPVGDVNIANIDYCIGRGLASIFMKNSENLFLFYVLTYLKPLIENEGYGSTFKAINKSKLQNFKIPLPPLTEQKNIALVLSSIQDAKEKTEQVIKALKETKRAMMKHLFTYGPVSMAEKQQVKLKNTEIGRIPEEWDVVRLGEYTQKTQQKDMRKVNNEFKYIDVSGIDRECLSVVYCKNYKGENAPSRARKIIRNNDVIVATVRPTLKRVAIIDQTFDNQVCSTAFCVLRAIEYLNPLFLFYFVQKDEFIERLEKIQSGASYPAVTDSDVKSQKISIPPLQTQQEIASILSAADERIEKEEAKREALGELFKSMLQNLMTAKIRVKDLVV